MTKINVKPITQNQAWKGRRFKSDLYKVFEQEVFYSLPKIIVPVGKLKAVYRFGLSNKQADLDNCIKQFQDVLSKKYGFNDCLIYRLEVEKIDCKKGEEFIEFELVAC